MVFEPKGRNRIRRPCNLGDEIRWGVSVRDRTRLCTPDQGTEKAQTAAVLYSSARAGLRLAFWSDAGIRVKAIHDQYLDAQIWLVGSHGIKFIAEGCQAS